MTGRPTAAAASGDRRHLLLFFVLAIAVFVADQLSKRWVDASFGLSKPSELAPGAVVPPTDVVDGLVRITKTYNNGALFGMFSSTAAVFAIASLAVIGVILWYELTRGGRGPILVTIALGLLLGGAAGNLVDRVRWGYVVDFVDMGIGGARFYIFNVADASISIAIVLLLAHSLWADRASRHVETPPFSPDPEERAADAPASDGMSR